MYTRQGVIAVDAHIVGEIHGVGQGTILILID